MADIVTEIRRVARQLLVDGQVDVVIGFRDSRLPLRSTPHFARTSEEVDQLVWGPGCSANLADYLIGRADRVAVVAKGCDARAIVAGAKENQIARERVTVIGAPCRGMVSWHKLEARLDGRDLTAAVVDEDEVILQGKGCEERVAVKELLQDACTSCTAREATGCDLRIGEADDTASAAPADEFADIRAFEALSANERWAWFGQEFSRCIHCYACRNACPACYCEQCFVDSTDPEWIGKNHDLSDTMIFHIVRAYHGAGRCVGCGACTRACPMGIELHRLTNKIRKDMKELFDADAGADPRTPPPLATHHADDPEDFAW